MIIKMDEWMYSWWNINLLIKYGGILKNIEAYQLIKLFFLEICYRLNIFMKWLLILWGS